MGDLLDNRYIVGDVSRSTATSTRFFGLDAKVGTSVEIEALDVSFGKHSLAAQALTYEAHLASRVDHPNASLPIDIGELPDGTPYVVRRRLDGETLSERLAITGPLPITDVVRLGIDLLSVLSAAHEAKVVHGALHPDHVFLVEHAGILLQSVLAGFGGARSEDDTYDSPERIDGCSASVASDLYGVGALLFVAATGSAPYTASRSPIPAPLVTVLMRALDADPERRFPTAHAMLHALLVVRVALGSAFAPLEDEALQRNEERSGIHPVGRRLGCPAISYEVAPETQPSAPHALRRERPHLMA